MDAVLGLYTGLRSVQWLSEVLNSILFSASVGSSRWIIKLTIYISLASLNLEHLPSFLWFLMAYYFWSLSLTILFLKNWILLIFSYLILPPAYIQIMHFNPEYSRGDIETFSSITHKTYDIQLSLREGLSFWSSAQGAWFLHCAITMCSLQQ